MERQTFSHGGNSRVMRRLPEERVRFAEADLVREVQREGLMRDPNHFKSLYYTHKVASLLFPDNFITVVGAQRGEKIEIDLFNENNEKGPDLFPQRLFSKEANIEPDHAIYTAHLEDDEGYKECSCGCETCQRHDAYHRKNGLEDKARQFADQTIKAGILLPSDDPSDYCLTNKGIIFFEVEEFDPVRTQKYLNRFSEFTQEQKLALSLTKRFQELDAEAHPHITKRTTEEYIL